MDFQYMQSAPIHACCPNTRMHVPVHAEGATESELNGKHAKEQFMCESINIVGT